MTILILLASLAWGASCDQPSSFSDFQAAAEIAEKGYFNVDDETLEQGLTQAATIFPCIDQPLTAGQSALAHYYFGLFSTIDDNSEQARGSFRATRLLSASFQLDHEMYPEDEQLATLFASSEEILVQPGVLLSKLDGTELLIDGARNVEALPIWRASIVQVLDRQGLVAHTEYLQIRKRLPPELVAVWQRISEHEIEVMKGERKKRRDDQQRELSKKGDQLAVRLRGELGETSARVTGHRHRADELLDYEMVWIMPSEHGVTLPAGKDKTTTRTIRLTAPVLMGATEVPQRLWDAYTAVDPTPPDQLGPDRPVHNVTWTEAARFCNALSKKAELPPVYEFNSGGGVARIDPSSFGYRLPTEAEWEAAARAGHPDATFGTPDLASGAMYKDTAAQGGDKKHPRSVGSRTANEWGFVDMSGNVAEWVSDWSAEVPSRDQTNPMGPPGPLKEKVVKGGSIVSKEGDILVSSRVSAKPDAAIYYIGLRIARTPKPGE
ncbi:MAG: sulfatase modifying factor 1 [Kiritimatiellia bacterium]|jgi:sulfatase modifying factor 1